MMDDRIGNIGQTHGVAARPRPAPMQMTMMSQRWPPARAALTPLSLACGAAAVAGGWGAAGAPARSATPAPITTLRSGSGNGVLPTLTLPCGGAVTGATTPAGAAASASALGTTLAESASAPKAFMVTATVRGCGG